MTTATRDRRYDYDVINIVTPGRIVYLVACEKFWIGEADDREGAEDVRDAHAARNNNDPLSDRYEITPIMRNRAEEERRRLTCQTG